MIGYEEPGAEFSRMHGKKQSPTFWFLCLLELCKQTECSGPLLSVFSPYTGPNTSHVGKDVNKVKVNLF